MRKTHPKQNLLNKIPSYLSRRRVWSVFATKTWVNTCAISSDERETVGGGYVGLDLFLDGKVIKEGYVVCG